MVSRSLVPLSSVASNLFSTAAARLAKHFQERERRSRSVIGVLQRIDFGLHVCQALILAPTREVANQIQKIGLALGDYEGVRCRSGIGGTSVRDDMDKLREGQHLVVGTHGRAIDVISKHHHRVDDLITFVLDEADEMLSRGFKGQIYDVFKCLPPKLRAM